MAARVNIPRKNRRLRAYNLMNEARYKDKRDRKDIDLDIIRNLAAIGATREEIATVLRCSTDWLNQEANKNASVALALDEGTAELKTSLRRVQVQMALSGNVPLLIWLGKQCLGQADKHEQNNKTEINVTVQRATEELRAIPRERLLESLALMNTPVIEHDDDKEIIPQAE